MTIFRVTLTGIRWAQVTMQNVLHFEDLSSVMTDDQVMLEIRDNWCQMWATHQSNTFGWRNISIQRIGAVASPANYPIVINGQDGVDNLGGSCVTNLKIRIHTNFPGRKGRGRFFLPAVRDQYIESGQFNQQAIANITPTIDAVGERYCNIQATGPLQLGVMGRGPENSGFHPSTGLHMSLVPGIQRRRNLGVGI